MITPSVGRHHDQPSAILEVDKGGGSRLTASSPCGRKEQGPASDYPRADESSRVTVDELMKLEVGILQHSRGRVAHWSHSLCRCRAVTMMIMSWYVAVGEYLAGGWRRSVRMAPHSSDPASRQNSVAAARSSTTIPTCSMRWIGSSSIPAARKCESADSLGWRSRRRQHECHGRVFAFGNHSADV
jgi:hypothetical protein